jgi:hypothetical protein
MVGRDGESARPDVPAFPPAAEVHLGLRLPFLGVADSHPDAVNWSDADRGAVRPVCLDMADAIPEVLRGRTAVAAEKLADLEPLPADAVPDHPVPAWVWFQELPAWDALVERWGQRLAVAAQCTPDAGPSAA